VNPTKPGIKSSEFWITILTSALAFVSALASANGWAFDGSRYQGLIPVAATVMAGLVALVYNHGRSNLKAAAIKAVSLAAAYSGTPAAAPAAAGVVVAVDASTNSGQTPDIDFGELPEDVEPPAVGTLTP
jgi:peptidoglycan/LPS O-acetylase OafA/YrhL